MSTPAPTTASAASGERRATWFELLFDLVFVAAVGQATHRVAGHPSPLELLVTAALFVPVWWMWVIYAYQANRFETEDRGTHRIIALVGMFGMCLVAVGLSGVGHGAAADRTFVAGYLLARAVPAVLYRLAARTNPTARPVFRTYASGSAVSAVLWLGGLALPVPGQAVAWLLAIGVEMGLPFLAGRRTRPLAHHVEHLKERFGLFTIIVIGEAVLAVVAGLSGQAVAAAGAVTAVLAFVLAAGVWWIYFNTGSLRAASHDEMVEKQWLRHVFTYGHLPAQLGLALAGAGVSVAILRAPDPPGATIAAAVFGGIGVYLIAIFAVRTTFRRRVTWDASVRLFGGVAATALIWPATMLPVPVSVGLLTGVVLAVAVLETWVCGASKG